MNDERQLIEKILRALPSSVHPSSRASGARLRDTEAKVRSRRQNALGSFVSTAVRVGPGDDAAVLSPSGETDWVLSCDASIEDIHFRVKTHPPDSVGYKSLARATSDLAAMGAAPRYFLLTLGLPNSLTGRWLGSFLKGMARASRELGIFIIGGDTTASPTVAISVSAFGEIPRGRAVLRSGAKPGDLIFVSGKLGRAQLGLSLVLDGCALHSKYRAEVRAHLYPKIQIELGAWLAKNRGATSMMDISDGLSTDLARLCAASGVGARIYTGKIPCVRIPSAASSELGKRKIDSLQMALHGGEDYELLFTVSPGQARQVRKAPRASALNAIGEITRNKILTVIDREGKQALLKPLGWDPF
jgi:thiamine-monophosphate kinase